MELKTKRLLLRRYRDDDIPALARLLGAKEVAATTLRIPHPYTEADARAFLKAQESPASKFGMFEISSGELIGGIGLSVDERHQHAELGYWVGPPYWGKGYATEAAREMLRHGFEDLKLNRIFAGVFTGNPASEQVLRKIGFTHEGTMRQHFQKNGKFLDDQCYGILASDWHAHRL
jgi:ribosomal-protein-alanine N-acetyltransferase